VVFEKFQHLPVQITSLGRPIHVLIYFVLFLAVADLLVSYFFNICIDAVMGSKSYKLVVSNEVNMGQEVSFGLFGSTVFFQCLTGLKPLLQVFLLE